MNQLTLILGNQLHPEWLQPGPLGLGRKDQVILIEDAGIATRYRYHRLRLLHTFVSMREFRDRLLRAGIPVRYFEFQDSLKVPFFKRLELELKGSGTLRVSEIPDRGFRKGFEEFTHKIGVRLETLPSPAFLSSPAHFDSHLDRNGKPFMKRFYEQERKRLQILLDRDGGPTGGKWSFDTENRKRIPNHYREPPLPETAPSTHEKTVRALIEKHFPDHPGDPGQLFIPTTPEGAEAWLTDFLKVRLEDFGPYEDAIAPGLDVLHHSLLSPLLNLGLLNPAQVVEATLKHTKKHKSPIASVEGFLRQIIGWREFVKGIDHRFGEFQEKSNFWNHHRKLGPSWYEGTTGIPPLDDAIRKAKRLAYNHHIERLMILSNLMLLSGIHPGEAYRWFMEMYLDSYEWVMGPNVYGMGLMSDGGVFATKPYISGSNYILKMSPYKKGPWCEEWDGLYWSFIERHRDFFLKNPRLSMMVRLMEKMPEKTRARHREAAARFIERTTLPG